MKELIEDGIVEEIERVKLANLVGGITTTKMEALESIPTWDEVLELSK